MEHAAADTTTTTTRRDTEPILFLPPFSRAQSSVEEYLVEPDVEEHDYASQPPPDEELPEYEEQGEVNLPDYRERHHQTPVVSYGVYQITRKVQIVTPAAIPSFSRPRYRVSARGASLFSKKADFTLTRIPAGRATASGDCKETDVATMNFDRNSQLPWFPRATVVQLEHNKVVPMDAPNFNDWKFAIDSQPFVWQLAENPTSLVLVEHCSASIVARFSYSAVGTDAIRGAEVGQLDIFGGSRSEDQDIVELVLASAQVAINHFKSMGRHYRNNVTPRTCSVISGAMGNSFFAHMATTPTNEGRRGSYIL
jgi:hypothetical protein